MEKQVWEEAIKFNQNACGDGQPDGSSHGSSANELNQVARLVAFVSHEFYLQNQ
ncbi:hypothetical protein B6N60_02428 [Richelia sinica FACHB-800]|uniref:Uncharacterized protein n=1 Tax=Richelia sinica FACHB-800 TaxID=1357546 RepID=A0A975T955_9NOST|nr:hypothetical protein B6N60_02428 [Richelia sinica FACHB-800]